MVCNKCHIKGHLAKACRRQTERRPTEYAKQIETPSTIKDGCESEEECQDETEIY